jgi:transcriptional regulator with XRE-family HTH domain
MQSNIIGNRLKELRLKMNITQQQLSNDLSVASSTISNWEKGRRLPSISDLKRIAKYFGVNLSCFDLDVELFDEESPLVNEMPHQIIDMRPIGYPPNKSNYGFLMIGWVLGTISIFLSNPKLTVLYVPISNIIIYGFFVFGLSFLLYVLFSAQAQQRSLKKNNSKRLLLKSDYHVFYMHDSRDNKLINKKRWIAPLSLSIILFAVAFYSMSFFLLKGSPLIIMEVFLALYALLTISMALVRHKAVKESMISKEKANYYEVRENMNYASFHLAWIVDLFGLLFIYLCMLINAKTIQYGTIMSIVCAVGIIYILVSYKIYSDFNDVISNYELYASDDKGSTIML